MAETAAQQPSPASAIVVAEVVTFGVALAIVIL